MHQIVDSYNSEQKIYSFIWFVKDFVDWTCSLYERNCSVHRFIYELETENVATPKSKKDWRFYKIWETKPRSFEFVNQSFEKGIWNRLQALF